MRPTWSEAGNGVIEGLAAMGIAFLILTVVVEASFLVAARNAAEATVAAGSRLLAKTGQVDGEDLTRIETSLRQAIPGASDVSVEAAIGPDRAFVRARFRWRPPGPDLVPVTVSVDSSSPRPTDP